MKSDGRFDAGVASGSEPPRRLSGATAWPRARTLCDEGLCERPVTAEAWTEALPRSLCRQRTVGALRSATRDRLRQSRRAAAPKHVAGHRRFRPTPKCSRRRTGAGVSLRWPREDAGRDFQHDPATVCRTSFRVRWRRRSRWYDHGRGERDSLEREPRRRAVENCLRRKTDSACRAIGTWLRWTSSSRPRPSPSARINRQVGQSSPGKLSSVMVDGGTTIVEQAQAALRSSLLAKRTCARFRSLDACCRSTNAHRLE